MQNYFHFYRFPSQTKNKFENLELNLEHIANKSLFLVALLGDFNARMQGWYENKISIWQLITSV